MLKSAISRAEAAVVSSGNSYASATLASKYSLAGQVVKVRVGVRARVRARVRLAAKFGLAGGGRARIHSHEVG